MIMGLDPLESKGLKMNSNLTRATTDVIYSQYEHFIVIGLTGRCGSGCSTTRGFFCDEKDFNPSTLHKSSVEHKGNNDRDLEVLINFAKKNRIFPFHVIKVRDVLTSYILDHIDAFYDVLKKIYSTNNPEDGFDKYIRKEFKKLYKTEFFLEDIIDENRKIWLALDTNIYDFISKMGKEEYDFLFQDLGRISDIVRRYLLTIDKEAYTVVYQYVANVVRTYGYLCQDIEGNNQNAESIHCIAKRINSLIKVLRRRDWICEGNKEKPIYKSDVHVVIDSLKNVFEANYLKARYHSFYLLAVTLDDNTRYKRLVEGKQLNEDQISVIDLREQPARAKRELKKGNPEYESILDKFDYMNIQRNAILNGTSIFSLQDVDACIQNADILINNEGSTDDLKRLVLRYACLMMHPGLVPPTDDERCMQIAQAAKLNSGCISRQVGAVICDNQKNVIAIGWNDPSATIGNECISCTRRNLHDLCTRGDEKAYSYYELYNPEFRAQIKNILIEQLNKKGIETTISSATSLKEIYKIYEENFKEELDGLQATYCFKDVFCSIDGDRNQVHTRAQHAEERAFESCDKHKAERGILYTTSSSCELCAKKALGYSISKIVYIEPYTGITNDHILGHSVSKGVDKVRKREDGEPKDCKESMEICLFSGATQRAYDQLYSRLFPMKDELELRGIIIK